MTRRELWSPLGLLFLMAVVVRLPYYFPAVIDWDESTFILIGQSVLDGHLPYAHLWDVKPPLLFAFFAATIGVFGDSLIGIRVAGTMCVALTAWLVYLTAARTLRPSAAWCAAGLCVLLGSLISSGQATTSEHVMLPALVSAVYLWLAPNRSFRIYLALGALMATATLVRFNISTTVLAFAVLIGTEPGTWRARTANLMAFALGGLAVVVVVCLPFALAGQLPLLWNSAVVAALARSEISVDIGARLGELIRTAVTVGGSGGVFWLAAFTWTAAGAGYIVAVRELGRKGAPAGAPLLAFLTASVCVGIAMSGGSFQHYLIQVVPFAALLAAPLAHYPRRGVRMGILTVAAAMTVASSGPLARQYQRVISRVVAGQDARHGPAYELAEYLERENADRRPVLLLADHVAHWFTKTEPPTRFVTHPSTLSRPHVLRVMGTTPREQLMAIFSKAPKFVVVNPNAIFLTGDDRAWFEATLAREYAPAVSIADRDVYRRVRLH